MLQPEPAELRLLSVVDIQIHKLINLANALLVGMNYHSLEEALLATCDRLANSIFWREANPSWYPESHTVSDLV